MKNRLLFLPALLVLMAIGLHLRPLADGVVVSSTSSVVTTQTTREVRSISFTWDRDSADPSVTLYYETVVRSYGETTNVVSAAPFRTDTLAWADATNAVPALTTLRAQFTPVMTNALATPSP